ncbi:MAG: TolC family protein [Planctomycetes bacterium]|nr:TolC family protein [Planctomycetota bacterium]
MSASIQRVWILICGSSLLLSGCASYQEKQIDPKAIALDWANMGAKVATQTLNSKSTDVKTYDLEDGISLHEAEVTALFYNPMIASSRLRSGLPEVQRKYAKLWDDPELDVDGEYFSSKQDDPLNYSGGLSLTIPLSGRLDIQKEVAEETLNAKKASLLAEEWALVIEVRERWVERNFILKKTRVLKELIADLETAIKLVPHFRAAKVATIVDEQNLLIEKEGLNDNLRQLQLEVQQNKLTLLSLMGLHPDIDWKLSVDEKEIERVVVAEKEKDLLSNPEIQKILSQYEVAQLRLKLAIRRQIPDLKLGLGAGAEEGTSLMAFGLGLSHLPFFNKNRLEIAESKIEREVQGKEIQKSIQSLLNKRASARERLKIAEARVQHMETTLVPLVNKQLKDAMRLTKLGELNIFLLVDAIQKKGEVKLSLIETQVEKSYAHLQALALNGPTFTSSTPPAEKTQQNNERSLNVYVY